MVIFVEKFFRPLNNSAIPVVFATKDVNKTAPPHSHIDIRDFKSPKHLADYLLYLDKNDTVYMSYFNWRKDYEVKLPDCSGPTVFCHLCRYMHTNNSTKITKDYNKWYYRKSECVNGYDEIKFGWSKNYHTQNLKAYWRGAVYQTFN